MFQDSSICRIITIWELTSGEISHSLKAHDEEIEVGESRHQITSTSDCTSFQLY